jgi:beta-glucosidase
VQRPVKWLVGFAVVEADPGASATAEIWVPERSLQHWTEGGWVLEPGTVVFAAGRSSASLPLIAEVEITA